MLLLVCLAAGTSATRAQEAVEPARGTFLLAAARIDRGPFHQSVVLLLAHGEDGTLGLIVNRPTDVTLADVLPDLPRGEVPHQLYLGGPVAVEGLVFLFRSETPPPGAQRVMEDVYYSGERDVLDRLLEEDDPGHDLRLFVGHSGWAPGQLDNELRKGAWDVVPADAFTLFRTEPEWMWEHLTKGGRTIARGLLPQR